MRQRWCAGPAPLEIHAALHPTRNQPRPPTATSSRWPGARSKPAATHTRHLQEIASTRGVEQQSTCQARASLRRRGFPGSAGIMLTGISILPAGSGPSYTNTPLRTPDFFSARYSAPNSRQVGPRSTGNRLEPLLSGYFSGTAPHVCPVFAASLHSGRASASRHWQRPDPPQHVAEQSPGQMPFRQQEPVVPRMLHQPAPGFH